MKQQIDQLIRAALTRLQSSGELPDVPVTFTVEGTRDKQHGDFATNVAMVLAREMKRKPREVAELIIGELPSAAHVAKVEIAGPGFINFFLSPDALLSVVPEILNKQHEFGRSKIGREKKVLIEFVSANPTGPLHVGHGRHAAYGAVVSNLLDAVGFLTFREYYVNDAGRQMDILAASVWLRYLELFGEAVKFPANGYRGEYVIEIARMLKDKDDDAYRFPAQQVFEALPKDEPEGGDKELYIDAVVERCKQLLGPKYRIVFDAGLAGILADISDDLAEFGVYFDNWFSEREFVATDVVDKMLEKMKASGYTYENEGALWFNSSAFGDEKDRVLVRSNGSRTYFANDVSYHMSKFDRGYDIAIDIFGADHHGYLARMKAAVAASDIDPERLIYLLGQFVALYRSGVKVQMSTRSGEFITLRDLRNEVGNDAARFFYVMRKYDNHIDFDLDLAKSKTNENPVFYVQYAHARICSVFNQLKDKALEYDQENGLKHLDLLVEPQERDILTALSRYPDMITNAAINYEPHLLTNYLRDLATDFHSYYNAHQFIVEDKNLRDARLSLVSAVKQILINGFNLLGITAPTSM